MTYIPNEYQAAEMEADLRLPFAVYGTLREGYGNDRTWRGLGFSWITGTIHDYKLVSNGSFPYAIPAEGQAITVELIVPTPGNYEQMEASMDMLEGVPVHYKRVTAAVETEQGTIVSWLYTPPDPEHYDRLKNVPGNDWANARQPREPHSRNPRHWWDR